MNTKVPLLNKAIKYINASDNDVKKAQEIFTKELLFSNSSITLMYVYSKLTEFEEQFENKERYILVLNAINEHMKDETEKNILKFDEKHGRFIKKTIKK